MNELGISLLWVALQISLLCVVSVGVYLIVRRGRPAAGSTALTSGMLMIVVVTAIACLPWSGWSWALTQSSPSTRQSMPDTAIVDAPTAVPAPLRPNRSSANGAQPNVEELTLDSRLAAFAEGFVNGLRQPAPETRTSWRWPGWLALVVTISLGVGLARILLGLYWVRRCRRTSQAVGDRDMRELLDVIRAESHCTQDIDLRSSREVVSAATIGCRRPVILLPENWRNWSPDERRSVLAHEVAHVAHKDSLYWLLAQVGLLLHFYHPLVHWLTGRLRLEQELAADESAARIAGGSQRYLTTLAELAVRQPDHRLAWPARTFLPTRGTLLRRIDMLRNTPRTDSAKSSLLRRATAITVTVLAGLALTGFRPPVSQQAHAQERLTLRTASTPVSSNEFNLRYVPPGVAMLVGARPAAFLSRDTGLPMVAQIDQLLEKTGLSMGDVSQVLMTLRTRNQGRALAEPVFEIRTAQPHDFSSLIALTAGETEERTTDGGITYRRASVGSDTAYYLPDDRTLLIGPERELTFMLDSTKPGPVVPTWRKEFATVASDEFCYLVDLAVLRTTIAQELSPQTNPLVGMFQPLWNDTKLLLAGATLSAPTSVHVTGWCGSTEGAVRVQRTVESLVSLGQNMLDGKRNQLRELPAEAQGAMSIVFAYAEDLLATLQIQQDGSRVTASVSTDEEVIPVMVALLLPAVQSARQAARQTQSKNNLKHIMLALHNYHDAHGSFPPPAVTGPDGTTKHSWRVAILPYVDEPTLFQEYDLRQPWDSQHNKKVLAKIPPVFRSPNDSATSTNTSYFALVGENTAFGDSDEGVQIRSFTDGTSNTGMVFEAKLPIPWTKPEDISFDPEADSPELGGWHRGGFNLGLSDGSVLFLSDAIDGSTLKKLITRDGTEKIDFSKFRR